MANTVKLTRKELYEMVWSKSMVQLAKEFSLSDVGLAKICKKHNIPRPGLGYWAKVEAGKHVEKPLLPNANNNPEITIDTSGKHRLMQDKHPYPAEKLREVSSLFSVPNTLTKSHPLIQKTKKTLLEHPDMYYRTLEVLNINVRKTNFSRSLRIMDTFIKIMESRGHKVEIQHDGPREYQTIVNIKNERIGVRLYEKDGILTFGLNPYVDGRKNWGDGKRVKLENKLYVIVLRILLLAREGLHRSIKWRIQRQKQEELERIQAEQERLRQEEEKRIQHLEMEVENWRKSRYTRDYLKAAVDFVTQKHGGYDEGSQFDLWLKWAHGHADRMDPLKLAEQ